MESKESSSTSATDIAASTEELAMAEEFPIAQEPQLAEEPPMDQDPPIVEEPSMTPSHSDSLTQSPYYNFLREYWVACDKDGLTAQAVVSEASKAWDSLEPHERELFEETNYLRARFGHTDMM